MKERGNLFGQKKVGVRDSKINSSKIRLIRRVGRGEIYYAYGTYGYIYEEGFVLGTDGRGLFQEFGKSCKVSIRQVEKLKSIGAVGPISV